jgi:hypothetical protein
MRLRLKNVIEIFYDKFKRKPSRENTHEKMKQKIEKSLYL